MCMNTHMYYMNLCVCIYTNMSIHLCICMHIWIYCKYICKYVYVCMCLCIWVHVYVYKYVMCVFVCICLYTCIFQLCLLRGLRINCIPVAEAWVLPRSCFLNAIFHWKYSFKKSWFQGWSRGSTRGTRSIVMHTNRTDLKNDEGMSEGHRNHLTGALAG